MSNYLGPATITAAMKLLLSERIKVDISDFVVNVTTTRPDKIPDADGEGYVNLYMYQVTPNAGWRGHDLPTRNSRGQLIQNPRMAIDLHYLITFAGNEGELQPQQMMGSTLHILHQQPILNKRWIDHAIQHPDYQALLQRSDIGKEVEQVKFTPQAFTLEEMSKLWSVLIQGPYQLSLAYMASVVFVEAQETVPRTRTVLEREVHVDPLVSPPPLPEPGSLPGLALWLRSDIGVVPDANSGELTWQDQSGNVRHAHQHHSDRQPRHEARGVGPHPVFHFDGIDDYLRLDWTLSAAIGEMTAAAVIHTENGGAQAVISFDGAAYWELMARDPGDSGPAWVSTNGGTDILVANQETVDGRWHVLFIEYDPAAKAKRIFVDGVLGGEVVVHGGTIGSGVSRPGRIGVNTIDDPGNDHAGARFFKGDLAELIVFDRHLNTVDRQQLERYFAQRYAHG